MFHIADWMTGARESASCCFSLSRRRCCMHFSRYARMVSVFGTTSLVSSCWTHRVLSLSCSYTGMRVPSETPGMGLFEALPRQKSDPATMATNRRDRASDRALSDEVRVPQSRYLETR